MNGRKPKPPELTVFNGNPGKRPIKKTPKPPRFDGVPSPPKWMGERGRKYWEENAPHLHKLGMLTTLDYHSFVSLCAAWNDFEIACEEIAKEGQTLEDSHGKKYKNPRINARAEAFAILRTLQACFCMTPSDRARIGNHESKEDKGVKEFLA